MNLPLIKRAGASGLALALTLAFVHADGPPVKDAGDQPAKISLSAASNPTKRAKWQERLTLGPGDILNFALLDQPDSRRNEVVIGPDGRVTYLQAENIVATGLTIDELRGKLDEALGKFYRSPRTLITPVAYNSKKYVVLGAVVNKGVFPLDRPTTIIEAIARAGGLQTGLFEQRAVELADLSHSFMIRDGKRLEVDFEKLFQQGDLTQNIALEPNDYLFFSSANANEIYVVGAVVAPGVVAYTPNASVVSAIASRGGYVDKAYKSRVLVVRGSLNRPETFVVDSRAVLAADSPDFKLQPKDIVYVSLRPWWRAEELLDSATLTFIQSAIVTWSGLHVGPFIESPIFE